MFDWDDEELANIIWGETDENQDRIVPYPDETHEKPPGSYGEHSNVSSDQESAKVKLTEKTTISITDSQECSNTNYDTHGKVSSDGFGSLPDFSALNATKLDLEHMGEKAQVDNGSQIFDNQLENRDRNNFVDYGWANVGNFDDLDSILSNNDLVYGNSNISNAEALWSSSKDVNGCPEKSELLSIDSPSLQLGDLKYDCQQVENKSGYLECGESKIENSLKEKMGERRKSQTSYDTWFSLGNQGKEFEGQYRQRTVNSSSKARNQQNEFYPCKQFVNPLPSPPVYNIIGPTLPQFHSGEEQQQMLPLNMTPQEKIEKLKRRQQMRALIAIRKQQQQFRHNSSFPKCSNESQLELARAGNVEIDENLSDSDTRSMMIDKSTLEDTILLQLENVIARLGIQIRVCIRDSLFRLAQSSRQRQSAGDTVSTNRSGSSESNVGVTEEKFNSTKSSAKTGDGETKTNPVDRAVAHLLFYTPPEFSGELAQSPSSAKPPCETAATSTNFPMGFLSKRYEKNQVSRMLGPDASENASSNETADGSRVEIEASSRGAPLR